MALKVGQLRSKEANVVFLGNEITGIIEGQEIAGDGEISVLKDRILILPLVESKPPLINPNKFFFVVNVYKQMRAKQIINIYLKNNQTDASFKQYIGTYKVPQGNENEYVRIEAVLSPNGNYNVILLELERTAADDYSQLNDPRIVNIKEDDYYIKPINDLLTSDFPLAGKSLKQIGVQGPSGLLMCINGEGIRIGPSGLYEIKENYNISSIGFAVDPSDTGLDGRNVFILDYLYE